MLELLEFFPLRYALLIPFLNTVGYFLKHKASLPNEFIPFVLFAIASAVSVGARWLSVPVHAGFMFWFDVVFTYGLVNALKLTLYAIGGYEAVRAAKFTSKRGEVQNKMKRGFIRSIIGIAGATLIMALVTVAFGSSFFGVFAHLTDAWAGIIFYAVIVDALWKIAKHRERITTAYIIMAVSILLSAIAFLVASATASRIVCFVGIALTAVFGITAAILGFIPYAKERKKIKESILKPFDENEYRANWVRVRDKLVRLSEDKQREILRGFLCFCLVGDNIYNDVDFSRPLFSVQDENGQELVMPVAKAQAANVSASAIDEASSYIETLLISLHKQEEK